MAGADGGAVAGDTVQLGAPSRAVFVATFVPLALVCIAGAPISVGLTLPFAGFFGWIAWFAACGGADPPAHPGRFLLICGFTIPLVVWAVVLIEGAV